MRWGRLKDVEVELKKLDQNWHGLECGIGIHSDECEMSSSSLIVIRWFHLCQTTKRTCDSKLLLS